MKLVGSICGNVLSIPCSGNRLLASKSGLYVTFQKDKCFVKVMPVWSWTAVGRMCMSITQKLPLVSFPLRVMV